MSVPPRRRGLMRTHARAARICRLVGHRWQTIGSNERATLVACRRCGVARFPLRQPEGPPN